jgi:glycosyltransferase involved in cell wall biosynthesis
MTAKKPKLLIVGAFPHADSQIYGGIVTTCRTLVDSSLSDNFDLILIDSTQRSNPPPSFGVRAILAFGRFFKFVFTFFLRRPDAVLLFTAVGASVLEKGAMAWVSRIRSIPVLLFPRGAGLIDTVKASSLHKAWVVAAMRGATHILCQGPAWKRFATSILGFSNSKAPIIQNWSATNRLLELGASRTDSLNSPTLLFLGWLEKEKGVFELLEACNELSKHHEFKLTIAGRGHAEKEARAYVADNHLECSVDFVGWVRGGDKEALLKKADILVLPSWAEGFPNAIIEAMAAKVAVVVTAVGNVPDLITDRQEAMLVPPRDCQSLKRAIEVLLESPEFRRDLAERGHDFARANFSVEKGIAKLTSVIEEAIDEKGSKSCVA